jgi:integrase
LWKPSLSDTLSGVSDISSLTDYERWLTKRGRVRSARQYSKIARKWLSDPGDMRHKLVSSHYAPNYRRNLIAGLRSWGHYSGNNDLLEALDDIKRPAAAPVQIREPLPKSLWFEVIAEIEGANYLAPGVRATCATIAIRGIRAGDVLRLRYQDVCNALQTGMLRYEAKGERWLTFRAAPIHRHLEILQTEMPQRGRVRDCVSPRARDETRQEAAVRRVERAFDRVAAYLALRPGELYCHRFRHTYATHFLNELQGDPEALLKLQQQMGWSRLDTAMHYLRRDRRHELDLVEERLYSRRVKENIDQ